MTTKNNNTITKSKAEPTEKLSASENKSSAVKSGKKTGPGKTKPASRTESKLQTCLGLLNSAEGITINDLVAATSWQAHSVRGFLAGTVKKKLNLVLESNKAADGVRRYRVMKAGG